MAIPPRYLFRCSSDQSHGTNTIDLFAPGSLSSTNTPEKDADFMALDDNATANNTTIGEQLRQALLWKKDSSPSPFIFFTTSPLFAVQLAVWRSKRKHHKEGTAQDPDTNVKITIIDTSTATTAAGQAVYFQSVKDLMSAHGIELRNRPDNSLRGYADVWVATSEVRLGVGSYCAGFGDLVTNGLFELYAAIEAASERRDVRLELTVRDLRGFYFGDGEETGGEEVREDLDTAARVAMGFRPCDGAEEGEQGRRGVAARLAFVLALRKRNLGTAAFEDWILDHTDSPADPGAASSTRRSVDFAGVPDAEQFDLLQQHFANFDFDPESLALGVSIDPASIEREKAAWATWWKNSRQAYRAEHPKEHRPRGAKRTRRENRHNLLLTRRARHDSVASQQPSKNVPQPSEAPGGYDFTHQGPRELFPGWQMSVETRRDYYTPHVDLQRGQVGYHVLSSRPGDDTTTQQVDRRGPRVQAGTPWHSQGRHRQYQVLSSRPGDLVTTRQLHGAQAERTMPRKGRDREGGWVKHRQGKTGRKGVLRY